MSAWTILFWQKTESEKNTVEVITWKLFWQAVRNLYQGLKNVHVL